MTKLWKKGKLALHPTIEKYTVGSDYAFDMQLLPFDIWASQAQARALKKAGIIASGELQKILHALNALAQNVAKGKVKIAPADEDCHTVIENYLVKQLGDTGKKIHTGRSRNDQVLVALRLYMKTQLAELHQSSRVLVASFLDFAEKYHDIPMPGYTHTQQAMLSSVGHYFTAYAESLLDDADFLATLIRSIDKNPLGSAAGFGTSIHLDRALTTKQLGFAEIQMNTLYCQNSRGKTESMVLEGLAQIMLTLGKFAGDVLLFTSQEFAFFSADDSLVTGSSIMPQKRNLDVLEILRGNVSVVIANQLLVKDISKNLLSGYNRDLQLLKKPLMESVAIVHDSLAVVRIVVAGITPEVESIQAKITPGIFAADIAHQLVREKSVPFRDAYQQAMNLLAQQSIDLKKNIASKASLGAPGNLGIKVLRDRLEQVDEIILAVCKGSPTQRALPT